MSNVRKFPMPQVDDEWRALLLENDKGYPKALLANAITAFRHHPNMTGRLCFDELRVEAMLISPPPWDTDKGWRPRFWTQLDDLKAAEWLQRQDIGVKPDIVRQGVEVVAQEKNFHPVRDYLNRLVWDGKPRVATWLSYYCGAEDTPYIRASGRCFLVAAVARVIRPGCKADSMPVFEGRQGLGKSTVAKIMGGEWFTDELAEFGSKDASMQMRGVWIIEISELDAMSKSEIGKIKAFLSRTTDRFRPAYGHRVIEQARQCVFIGSTNQDVYLKDPTGGRRFWPVKLVSIDRDALIGDRDQLWAEAIHLFRQNEPWWFTDEAIIGAAEEEQMDRYEEDPWQPLIGKYLTVRTETSVEEILTELIGTPKDRWSRNDQMRVAACLKLMKWTRYRLTTGNRPYRYRRNGAA